MRQLPLISIPSMRPLLLMGLAAVMLSIAGASTRDRHGASQADPARASVTRHIQYAFTVQNETSRPLDQVEIWVFAPGSLDRGQHCEHLAASHPFDVLTDDAGNRTLHFRFSDLPPYAAKIVTIRADLTLLQLHRPSGKGEAEKYLDPEPLIESDDPAIRKLAGTLRAVSPAETAQRIFDWVASGIRYSGHHPRNRGALYALKHRKGDCTELAALFTACCRACGIPARMVGGFVCDGDSVPKAEDYHDWAEFNVDGNWLIADPQRRAFRGDSSRYVVMGGTGARGAIQEKRFCRFRSEGNGVGVTMTP